MRTTIRDLTSGLATLALIAVMFTAAAHIQPVADATAAEARQA
ncbi:hypothetical protein [Brevundimonas sp.]|nr:hypothetical protein [Brevundimonas sp.]